MDRLYHRHPARPGSHGAAGPRFGGGDAMRRGTRRPWRRLACVALPWWVLVHGALFALVAVRPDLRNDVDDGADRVYTASIGTSFSLVAAIHERL